MRTELFVTVIIILAIIVLMSVLRRYPRIPKDHSCICYGYEDGLKCVCIVPGKKKIIKYIRF